MANALVKFIMPRPGRRFERALVSWCIEDPIAPAPRTRTGNARASRWWRVAQSAEAHSCAFVIRGITRTICFAEHRRSLDLARTRKCRGSVCGGFLTRLGLRKLFRFFLPSFSGVHGVALPSLFAPGGRSALTRGLIARAVDKGIGQINVGVAVAIYEFTVILGIARVVEEPYVICATRDAHLLVLSKAIACGREADWEVVAVAQPNADRPVKLSIRSI